MDYAIPHAEQVPHYELEHTETATTVNPLGHQRCRRSRHDRFDAGDRQRDHRCARAVRRHPHRHAAAAREAVDRDAEREPRDDPGRVRLRPRRPASRKRSGSSIEGGDDAKLLAGGHSLIPMMKLRFASPAKLIDIAGIPHLADIAIAGGRDLDRRAGDPRVARGRRAAGRAAPALWDAANGSAIAQVRNRGTIGGSAAHADAAADYPAVSWRSRRCSASPGRRAATELPAAEFFLGMFETALDHDEVLTGVSFDAAPHSAYVKYHHPASHYAVVGAAAVLEMKGDRSPRRASRSRAWANGRSGRPPSNARSPA